MMAAAAFGAIGLLAKSCLSITLYAKANIGRGSRFDAGKKRALLGRRADTSASIDAKKVAKNWIIPSPNRERFTRDTF